MRIGLRLLALVCLLVPAAAYAQVDLDNRMFTDCGFTADPPAYDVTGPFCTSSAVMTPAGYVTTTTVRTGIHFPMNVFVGTVGPNTATTVVSTTTLPAGIRYLGQLHPAGGSAVCTTPPIGSNGGTITCSYATLPFAGPEGYGGTFDLEIDPSVPALTHLTITSNVTTGSADPNPANNGAVATIIASAASANVPALSGGMLALLASLLAAAGFFLRR